MVEGHGTHRVAAQHRRELVGKTFVADSPNGRFVEGAAAISGLQLNDAQCFGKNLWYTFGAGDKSVHVHVHFGMSGRFSTHALPGPATTPTTRLRLVCAASRLVALCSAMTVEHGGGEWAAQKQAAIGPDPLREDADGERFWQRMQATSRPVGALLMDQGCVAGVGNIYRAEVLFKSGVHPETPGKHVDRAAFERLWRHSVDLLQRGFTTGSILTVDPAEGLPAPWTRRYVYNQESCGRCGGGVSTWDMAARRVYACLGCQPLALPAGAQLPAARLKALAARKGATLFASHCAPDSDGEGDGAGDGVRAGKRPRGGPGSGGAPAAAEEEAAAAPAAAAAAAAAPGPRPPRTGTAHLRMAPEAAAVADKAAAGESAAVEHVALADDASAAARAAAAAAKATKAKAKKEKEAAAAPATRGRLRRAGAAKKAGGGDGEAEEEDEPAAAADAGEPPGRLPFPKRRGRA